MTSVERPVGGGRPADRIGSAQPRSPSAPDPTVGQLPGPHEHPCSDACTVPHQQVGHPVRVLRALSAIGVVAVGLACTALIDPSHPRARPVARVWSAALLWSLGVRLEVHGPAGSGVPYSFPAGALIASNHISWLDMAALSAVDPVCLVAKAEVAGWPLLGRLASWAGTVYLKRSSATALREAVDEVAQQLRGGASVGFFPEGVTWCGRAGGSYRPALFQAALDCGAPVVPVVLRYRAPGNEPATAHAYTLIPLGRSIRTVLGLRRLVVEVHVLEPIAATTSTGRAELARRVQRRADAIRFAPFATASSTVGQEAPSQDSRGTA